MSMTGAELKSDVEALGLTSQWLADHFNVQKRTVDYWMSGRFRVPDDVAQFVAAQETKVQSIIQRAMASVDALTADRLDAPEIIGLVRYRTDAELWRHHPDMIGVPASYHAATISRVRRALWARGLPSVIVWMDEPVYVAWRAGEPDSPEARQRWAAYEAGLSAGEQKKRV